MSVDGALDLFRNAMLICAKVAGPLLLVALVVGLLVGILQTATQVNEASISFVVKLVAMGATVVALGGWTLQSLVDYTHRTIASIAEIVR